MALITITITEATIQVLSGIPKYVILSTDIPSSIYYTFDGSIPDTNSLIYLSGELLLPVDQTTVILSLLATNGVDFSQIISRTYYPDLSDVRRPRETVLNLDNNTGRSYFPYGDLSPTIPVLYGGPGGDIVKKPGVAPWPDGYGWDGTATGTGVGFTDKALTSYELKFSETDYEGRKGNGIGTLPAKVTIVPPTPPPKFSSTNSATFDPRAIIIYQDNTVEQYDKNVPNINRQYFSLENAEKVKDGILLNTTSQEGLAPTGSFVNSVFDPKHNTIKYYYFDSQTLRWIISKESYQPSATQGRLYNITFSSRAHEKFVYRWVPFQRRRLM